ncbi:TrkH family potassium uptake protein [Porphyromonas levii]|uniref:TrkH family potassium uptake protein n=1 Tax=Porphyromonas levii TaxID=28114 RepID=A0A4Y8WS09_9PORP|nr:TrkH family potassium uptake protein [Porphyromonas levii]MBR8704158.1 Trk system potassium uptake protein TrkG [Porphyromonas levii]MBR8713279.1 Trk system potassium uptake protein TrkG [Porphyromonas levii]MBR8715311.1 Trk system potassium uptake protein TrkG [Porphyromonas levii]MBR8727837.1 Trk system potassium uptake protein TrkG [Porphyromonas levii]MBR8729462.1 Trk system potassium uptake protein TrkG [Porphyromonas levii]
MLFLVHSEYETKRGFNYKFVLMVLGLLCLFQVIFLGISAGVSLYYGDSGLHSLLYTMGLDVVIGATLFLLGKGHTEYDTGRREGMVTVSLSWLVMSLLGMMPYWLGGFIPNFSEAYFEAMSGFSTTGSTILNDIESLPRSILFWRSVTQWIGGIGIIVFLVALVPFTGENASVVFDHETTGITHDRFVPRIGVMAKWITLIYVVLSIICALLLWAGPLSLYDAVCHAATCISTGGFSTYNASIADIDSVYTNFILTVFMFIGATSFTLIYFAIVRKEPKRLFHDAEYRWFASTIVVVTLFTAIWLYANGIYISFWKALLHSLFQVVSLITTTGYVIQDYNFWGGSFWVVALFLMFVAGCSGSTSGGLKMIRFNILSRNLLNEFKRRTHPQAIVPLRYNGTFIKEKVVNQVYNFLYAYLTIILIATFSVTLEGYSFTDAVSASIACISNSGPGLSAFGPMANFSTLSDFNTFLMSFLMLTGRLEIFTVLTLLHRSFWRN